MLLPYQFAKATMADKRWAMANKKWIMDSGAGGARFQGVQVKDDKTRAMLARCRAEGSKGSRDHVDDV
jgi:hypothetical protein